MHNNAVFKLVAITEYVVDDPDDPTLSQTDKQDIEDWSKDMYLELFFIQQSDKIGIFNSRKI